YSATGALASDSFSRGERYMFVTDIQDARAMRNMGAPLNTPVEHRVFDRAVSKHWLRLAKAEDSLDAALYDFIQGPRAGSVRQVKLLKRSKKTLHPCCS